MVSSPLRPSLKNIIATFFKIRCLSFGGATGQIAMMHRDIVDKKRWISERDYLDGLNFCTRNLFEPDISDNQLCENTDRVYVSFLA